MRDAKQRLKEEMQTREKQDADMRLLFERRDAK